MKHFYVLAATVLGLHAERACGQTLPRRATPLSPSVLLPGPAPANPSDAAPVMVPDGLRYDPGPRRSRHRFWATGEYLLWWIKGAPLPTPLLTGSNPADAGVLGRPTTRVLFGGEDVNLEGRSGGRFSAGVWFDRGQRAGLEGSYLFLGSHAVRQFAGVSGDRLDTLLAVPFRDANPAAPGESSVVVSAPNAFSGAADLTVNSELWGAELNGVVRLWSEPRWSVGLLFGFRYLQMNESLTYRTSSPDFPPSTPDDVRLTFDGFDARNRFYGGQLGGRVEYAAGRFFIRATGKLALGSVQQRVTIAGTTLTNDFTDSTGPAQQFPGGYLAQRTNLGAYERDRFAVVPEVTVNVGCQVTRRMRASVGYTFLYLSEAARPGNHIDRVINSSQSEAIQFAPQVGGLTGPGRPAFSFRDSDFWAQGINLGLEFRY